MENLNQVIENLTKVSPENLEFGEVYIAVPNPDVTVKIASEKEGEFLEISVFEQFKQETGKIGFISKHVGYTLPDFEKSNTVFSPKPSGTKKSKIKVSEREFMFFELPDSPKQVAALTKKGVAMSKHIDLMGAFGFNLD